MSSPAASPTASPLAERSISFGSVEVAFCGLLSMCQVALLVVSLQTIFYLESFGECQLNGPNRGGKKAAAGRTQRQWLRLARRCARA